MPTLFQGMPIINDSTKEEATAPPKGQSRGRRKPREAGMLSDTVRGVTRFPEEMIIPRSEWQARIAEREERKARSRDITALNRLPCKDQGQTNFCWANAPVYALELRRLRMNLPMRLLSPASVACPIKGFSNVGGWGGEALEFLVTHGATPIDLWPANAISRKYYTDASKAEALFYRVDEWWELEPRNLDQLISLLLHGFPGAGGYNWWSHEVTNEDVVWLDGQAWPVIRNSWSLSWGSEGYSILQGSKALADDLVAPRSALAA